MDAAGPQVRGQRVPFEGVFDLFTNIPCDRAQRLYRNAQRVRRADAKAGHPGYVGRVGKGSQVGEEGGCVHFFWLF